MSRARNESYRILLSTMRGHEEEINRIAWSPDGCWLASSSFDKTVRVWDARAGQQLHTLQGHSGSVYGVVWSPDGRLLASCSQDKSVLAWDVQAQKYLPHPVGRHEGDVYDLAWLFGSSFIASCSADHTIRTWFLQNHVRSSPAAILRGHSSEVYCLLSLPQLNVLVSGSSQGPMRFWDVQYPAFVINSIHVDSRGILETLRVHKEGVNSLACSPGGQFLASGSEDRTIQIWHVKGSIPIGAYLSQGSQKISLQVGSQKALLNPRLKS